MKRWKYVYIILLLVFALVVIALFQIPDSRLHLIACDVGQGDATLLVYRDVQVLIDGGPDEKVLECLGKYLPFWERELELVILTHPDKDHFQGLTEVFRRYKVDNYLTNPISISKPEYGVLEKEVGSQRIKVLYPYYGQVIRLGMIYLDIVSPQAYTDGLEEPEGNLKEISESETNGYSIASLVSFGKFNALLTGDMTPEASDRLATELTGETVNYIKVPHHGSRNGMTENLLKALEPKIAVISVGKNNIYGHPAPETLDLLKKYNVETLRTDEAGDIEFSTDGERFWRRR